MHPIAALIAWSALNGPLPSTIHVPADYPTIQLAIDAAVDGDSIRVAPGTYPETIDFLGKAIDVESTAGAGVTTIDGTGLGRSVVTFQTGETSATVLRGFTIEHGEGTFRSGQRIGGGVVILGASPTVEQNTVTANVVSDFGGGLYAEDSSALLRENRWTHNTAGVDGGGCYCTRSEMVFEDNDFEDNHALSQGGGAAVVGGGVSDLAPRLHGNHFENNQASDGAGLFIHTVVCDVFDNDFVGNWADEGAGGGISAVIVSGMIHGNRLSANLTDFLAAATIWSDSPVEFVENVLDDHERSIAYYAITSGQRGPTIARNTVTNSSQGVGVYGGSVLVSCNRLTGRAGFDSDHAGIYFEESSGTKVADFNHVRGFLDGFHASYCNDIHLHGNWFEDFDGNGMALYGSDLRCTDNVIRGGNYSGIYSFDSTPHLIRTTITDNHTNFKGGGIFASGSRAPRVESSIVWGNTAATGPSIFDETGLLTVEWSDVEGGFTGTGNIDIDPAFRDAFQQDYRLSAGSPCIDAGSPTDDPCAEMDGLWTPRALDGDLDRQRRVDMGAVEFTHGDLAVQGTFTPGGSITIDLTGTAGLRALMFVGLTEDAACDSRYGGLFVSLSGGLLIPWGTVPSTTNATLPSTLPTPLDIRLQALTLDPATKAGSFSNLALIPVR